VSRPLRFTFIVFLAALGTALAAVGGWRYARASAPASGPIILISVDTLRADHLPAYGYERVRTPAIDALAADGVVFERAYSHAPQTLPAHAALLTGRLPFETGVRDNLGFSLESGERLLPQMLRERGYATGGVVSTMVLRKETGIAQGFDFFDGDIPWPPNMTVAQVQRDGATSEAIAERWLSSIGSPRAFLFLHLYEPHKPYAPPGRFSELAPYDGEIAYADEIIGTFIRYLKSRQLYEQSTIALVSDHGEGLGDHGEQEHGLFVYDDAIHVPLIVKQEGNAGAGRRVADVVQQIDLVPTILDLVKAPDPGHLRGRSLKPLLDGTGTLADTPVYSEALYARYHLGWSELTAVTAGRYRYIKAPREELYDLQRDPHERANLALEHTQTRQALRGALDRLMAGAIIHQPAAVSADARERLQALGYVAAQGGISTTSGNDLADPKDKDHLLETYRAAIDLAGDRKWTAAIARLQQVLREDPGMADGWSQLAQCADRLDRLDLAVEAFGHYIELQPSDPAGYLGAAAALLKQRKLDEARDHAQLAADVARRDAHARAASHELLARIALARHDADTARREARLAREADTKLPMPAYVEGRLLYDQGDYDEALARFLEATAEQQNSRAGFLRDLHYYAGDTLSRLERYAEAEAQFKLELETFPHDGRAHAALAMLYQTTGRAEAASQVLTEMLRATPTPETYALAARVWTTIGNRQQAEAIRAEARRVFGGSSRAGARH
jgi:arylsulfatase A-like enzyme/Tfp pilus assembly protein PilF